MTQAANASLIGADIFIDRIIPGAPLSPFSFCQESVGTGPDGCPVTVAEGDSDRIALTTAGNLFANVEASSILLDFGPGPGSGGPIESHLIVFRDLDWIGTPGRITGFTFDTTLTGMDRNRISFTDDGVTVNYADLNFAGGEYLDIFLETSHVPIPAAAWLFGSSLAGLLGVARARVIR